MSITFLIMNPKNEENRDGRKWREAGEELHTHV
jgi:hypothetical protein